MSSTENICTPITGRTHVCGDPRGLTTFSAHNCTQTGSSRGWLIPGLACWVIIVKLRIFPGPCKIVSSPLSPDALVPSVTGPGVLNPEMFVLTKNCEFLGIDSGSCANVPTSSCRRLGPQTSRRKVAVFIVNFDTQILTEFTNEKVNIATLDPQSE